MSRSSKVIWQQIIGFVAFIALLAALSHVFPLVEMMAAVREKVSHMGRGAVVIYPLLYALCNILLLPGGILSVAAGFFFELWRGFLIVLIGNMIGGAVAFFISRTLGRRAVMRLVQRRPKWAALDKAVEREGWKIIVLSQVHPFFPTSLINYIYGLTRIRFWSCMLWVMVGRAPGIFLYVYLGTLGQFGLNLFQGKSQPRPVEYVFWIGGLVLTIVITAALARVALQLLEQAQREAESRVAARQPKADVESAVR